MIPFDQLTKRGKAQRLRKLAINALTDYDLQITKLELVGMYTNTLFRIRTQDKQSYIIRICAPNWRTTADRHAEVEWLLGLANDPHIQAPVPLAAKDGRYITIAETPGIIPCECLVTSWLPGRLLSAQLNENNLHKMGQLFARLHAFSGDFQPSANFSKRQMASVFSRDEPVVLFDENSRAEYTPLTWDILQQTWKIVGKAFEGLYADQAGLRVIHNDLHHENIKVYHGRLLPFDFEDTLWGYPIQDIAMAMQDLMIDVKPEEYEPYLQAFRGGYETLSPWPEDYAGQMDTFRAGRMFWVINYVAKMESEHLADFSKQIARLFEYFLENGRLRKL